MTMLKELWNQVVRNWKTSATGLASVLIWMLDEIFKFGLTAEQKSFITSVLIGLGLFFAKDGDKTGVK